MNLIESLFAKTIQRAVRAQLKVIENDLTLGVGARTASQSDRDRFTYDRRQVMEDCLEAWRTNPLARRIVGLTSQYVVGSGLTFNCPNESVSKFLNEIWKHPLNHLSTRAVEWCDELTRTGNLFIVISTDSAGMSYFRAVPAQYVTEITAQPNDIEQETGFTVELQPGEETYFPAYNPMYENVLPIGGHVSFPTVMVHYAINRPSGAQWGESDLAPVLKWLSRYSNWLEDRARLNRYRNSFLFIVNGRYLSEADRLAHQAALNAHPPAPGSIMVADVDETWTVLNPQLESQDANADGLALKKMIAAGAGIPMHFLAEPEGSTRTTAEAAGGPTYRHFEQRQEFFTWLLTDLLTAALNRRASIDSTIDPTSEFEFSGSDISSRDNVSLATASSNMINVLSQLRDRNLIDDEEYLRIFYRFSGETADINDMLTRASHNKPSVIANVAKQSPARAGKKFIDPDTGEEKPEKPDSKNNPLFFSAPLRLCVRPSYEPEESPQLIKQKGESVNGLADNR